MLSTEAGLIATILANPKDATARLVYADHLKEQGESRAEDEAKMRKEAKEIQSAAGGLVVHAMTYLEVQLVASDDRYAVAETWANRWESLLETAIMSHTKGLGHITLKVEHGESRWGGRKRPKVQVRARRVKENKSFPIGKNGGFSAAKIIAFAIDCHNRSDGILVSQREAEARESRMCAASKELANEYGVSDWPSGYTDACYAAPSGENVALTLSRSPDEMRRLLRCLKDNGFLDAKKED